MKASLLKSQARIKIQLLPLPLLDGLLAGERERLRDPPEDLERFLCLKDPSD